MPYHPKPGVHPLNYHLKYLILHKVKISSEWKDYKDVYNVTSLPLVYSSPSVDIQK